MRRRNEPTGTPGARDGEAWTPVAESKRTLVVPWIAQKPASLGPTTPKPIDSKWLRSIRPKRRRCFGRSDRSALREGESDHLSEGMDRGCAKTAGTCWKLLAGETHRWTLVRVESVEPTNNDAERAIRHGVLYRKLIGGTASESGSGFMQRMLTVVATCRRQDISVLDNLTRCYQAHLDGSPIPSLIPTAPIAHAAQSDLERLLGSVFDNRRCAPRGGG